MLRRLFFFPAALAGCALAHVAPSSVESTVPYPGEPVQAAVGNRSERSASLRNDVLSYALDEKGRGIFSHAAEGSPAVRSDVPFSVSTSEGEFRADSFRLLSSESVDVKAEPDATRAAARQPGRAVVEVFVSEQAGLKVVRESELRDGSHYIRQRFTVTALKDVVLKRFYPLIWERRPGMSIPGDVPGTPLVDASLRMFWGVELPVAIAAMEEREATVGFGCELPMAAGESYHFSVAFGVYPEGQLRRGFLSYLERERAVPWHPFLHYNCWYDHGLNPTEENMLETVRAYGEELVQKRGIRLDSFVLDDGWDDYNADLWQPNPAKFPQGFGKLSEAIRSIGSHFGIWISPLGGYSGIAERTAHAQKMGLIPPEQSSLDLSCPGYYNWFLHRCKELMEKDGVNFFKWDRAGGGVSPHFMSLLRISGELRKVNPSVFLSTTVGTWPSPYWLQYVDCIWRTGSSDVNWMGEGSNREQYITYRDARCYDLIVCRAPLFPLNSLMHHGIVLGTQFQARRTSDKRIYEGGMAKEPEAGDGDFLTDTTAQAVDFPVNNDLQRDIRILLGSGTNLQELYLTPSMMNEKAWDDVAEAIRWSQRFADVLADTHWVGGNPAQGQVYGYASWRGDRGATLALRNPSSRPQIIQVTKDFFEPLPGRKVGRLTASYANQRVRELPLDEGDACEVELLPFEVLVFDTRYDGGAPAPAQEKDAPNPR